MKLKFKKTLADETVEYLKKNNLLTVSEYSKRSGKSEWTTRLLCRQGNLPCHRLGDMWVVKED